VQEHRSRPAEAEAARQARLTNAQRGARGDALSQGSAIEAGFGRVTAEIFFLARAFGVY